MLQELPAVRYHAVRPRTEVSALRSDIAGFVGRTRRGPVDRLVRVEGWREFEQHFGGLGSDLPMTFAIRGYFANGGEIAHVHRVLTGPTSWYCGYWTIPTNGRTRTMEALLHDVNLKPDDSFFHVPLMANSPGEWASNMKLQIWSFRERDAIRFEFLVRPVGEAGERFSVTLGLSNSSWGAALQKLDDDISRSSRFVISQFSELEKQILDLPTAIEAMQLLSGQRLPQIQFQQCLCDRESSEPLRCFERLIDEPEVAIIVHVDDVNDDVESPISVSLEHSLGKINETKDRLVVTGRRFASRQELTNQNVIAAYSPLLKVDDPILKRSRSVSPAGHVAGLMSRFDRDRGAHFTPANAILHDVIDLDDHQVAESEQDSQVGYVNQIRCVPGQGLMVWGGRTLDPSPQGRFVSHQRFLHRLVRGVRSVALPLVAETNGPELWRTLTRAVTSLLLEAFHGGALRGAQPDEAFFVLCNEKNNPYVDRVNGRVVCEIGVALAAPMEFITIRISVSDSGDLEVFES